MAQAIAETAGASWSSSWLGSMSPYDVYAIVVGVTMLTVAAAQWLASYGTDRRALRLFSLRYALAALGWFFAHPAAQPQKVPFVSALVAIGLLTLTVWALDEYIGHASRRRLAATWALAAAASACLWLYLRFNPDSHMAVYAAISAAMCWCAWLCWQASRRETGVGYLYIAIAFATYPLTLLLTLFTPLSRLQLEFGYLAALPALVLGVTILVVSLLRARKRVEDELALRHKAEAALRNLNASLEQRVQSRTAELQQIVEGLEAFTRNVSHDLRGPLAGISGLARFSAKALDDGDAQRATVLVNAMADEAGRLQAMVGDLLALSKVGDGELHLHPQPLRSVVDAAVRQLELTPDGAESLHRVDLQIDELPTSLADPELLGQVFVNLIGNAARFSASQHPGGGQGMVRVGAEARGGETAIYVADDGPGFEPARADDLFKPFRRLHDARLSHNGIGLSIVKRIVERHGGRVWAETRPGTGATFWFTLGNGDARRPDFSPSP